MQILKKLEKSTATRFARSDIFLFRCLPQKEKKSLILDPFVTSALSQKLYSTSLAFNMYQFTIQTWVNASK